MVDNQLYPLTIEGIQPGDEQKSPLLLLRDDVGRELRIAIGVCEALAIQRALDGQQTSRPLTHDLILTLAERLEAPISRVVIDDFSNGAYYARLILRAPDGQVSLDCRPSDGVALALRANAPVFASAAVMQDESTNEEA